VADIATLTVRINAATGELTAELKGLEQSVNKTFSSLSTMSVAAGVALGNLAVKGLGVVTQYATDAVRDVIVLGGTLTDLSAKTGVSMRTLQEWGFAAEQAGSSLEAVTRASTELGRRVFEGSKGTGEALASIGLSIGQILALNPEQRFETVAAAIAKIEDPAARAAAETALLGKAGVALDPAIQRFAALTEQARNLGIAISDETLRAADEFGDQMDILTAQGKALIAEFLQPMLPLIAQVATAMTSFGKDVLPGVRDWIVNIARSFIEFDTGIQKVIRGLAEAAQWAPNFVVNQEQVAAAIGRANAVIAANEARLKGLDTQIRMVSSHVTSDFTPAVGRSAEELARLKAEQEKAAAAAKKHADELARLSGADVLAGAAKLAANIKEIGGVSKIAFTEVERVHEEFTKAIQIAEQRGQVVPQWWRDIAFETRNAQADLADYHTGFAGLLDAFARADITVPKPPQGLVEGFGDLLKIFPQIAKERDEALKPPKDVEDWKDYGTQSTQTIQRTLEGGSNIGAAIGAQIGQMIGKEITKAIVESMSKKAAAQWGEAIGGLVGIGVTLIGAGFSKLFGPGEHEKVNDMRDAFIDAAGGLAALNVKAHDAGMTLDGLLQAKSVKAYEAAVKNLTSAIGAAEKKAHDFAAALQLAGGKNSLLSPELLKGLQDLKPGTEGAAAAFQFFQQQTQLASSGLNAFLQNATITTQASATAITGALGGIYEDLRAQGLSSTEAFAQLQPTITALAAQLTATGLSGGAAFQALADQAAGAADTVAGPLFTAAAGLGDLLVATANTGRLTQDMFTGLAGEVTATWKQIELAGRGGTAGIANMQKPLQVVWELWKDQGYAIDDTTAELLTFAENSGQVGDQFRSDQDKMQKAVELLISRIDLLVKTLTENLPKAAASGAQGLETALGQIEPPVIDVHFRYVADNDLPEGGGTGGGASAFGAPTALTPTSLMGAATVRVAVQIDGERIAEAAARYSGRVLTPYGVGVA